MNSRTRVPSSLVYLSLPLGSTYAITKATTSPSDDAMMERAPKKQRSKALALANGVALERCTMEDVERCTSANLERAHVDARRGTRVRAASRLEP